MTEANNTANTAVNTAGNGTDAATPVRNATPHNNKGDLFTSFDVEDFEVPGGRDEVWRFVSLRRLRGLHNGTFAAQAPAQIAVEGPSEVTVEQGAGCSGWASCSAPSAPSSIRNTPWCSG